MVIAPALCACAVPPGPAFPSLPVIESFGARLDGSSPSSFDLSWRTQNADRVELVFDQQRHSVDPVGHFALDTDGITTKVELVASNAHGSRLASMVLSAAEATSVRIERFLVRPSSIQSEEPVEVEWDAPGATYVTIRASDGVEIYRGPEARGQTSFRPTSDVTIELLAEGRGMPQSRHAQVIVNARPSITLFDLKPLIIHPSEVATLDFATFGADEVIIEAQTNSGTEVLSEFVPSGELTIAGARGTTLVQITARNRHTTVTDAARLEVLPGRPAELLRFSLSSSVSGPGGEVLVELNARNVRGLEVGERSRIRVVPIGPQHFVVGLGQRSGFVDARVTGEDETTLLASRPFTIQSDFPEILALTTEWTGGSQFVLRAAGNRIDAIELRSASGNLIAATEGPSGVFDSLSLPPRFEVRAVNAAGSTSRFLSRP